MKVKNEEIYPCTGKEIVSLGEIMKAKERNDPLPHPHAQRHYMLQEERP